MLGDRYVAVPAEAMFSFLEGKGFVRVPQRSRREVVYERAHAADPSYKVLVFTSIAAGNAVARKRGADAIRVVAIRDDGPRSHGVAKLPKVLRTGSVEAVLERTLERMRGAYAAINRRIASRQIRFDARGLPVQEADLSDENRETEIYRQAMGEDGR